MKRYGWKITGQALVDLIECPHGELVLYKDAIGQRLDKPAALMALIAYSNYNKTNEPARAISKLAAAIIAEVEADNE
jgi:hypothetical protein